MSFTPHACLPLDRKRKWRYQNRGQAGHADDGPDVRPFLEVESMEASDYLRQVVDEASRLPNVFVSPPVKTTNNNKVDDEDNPQQDNLKAEFHDKDEIPIQGTAASLRYLVSRRTQLYKAPTVHHLPQQGGNTTVWVQHCLENFERVRQYLEELQERGVGGKGTDRLPVPPMKDRAGWHIFCVGRDSARGNEGSYFDNDDCDDGRANKIVQRDNASEEPDDTDEEPWERNLPEQGYKPTVSLLLQMDQVMVRRVLGHLAHYVSIGWSPCTSKRGAWLYALLARLARPVHREEAATLYGLLKKLTVLRGSIQIEENDHTCSSEKVLFNERDDLAMLNVLITVIGIYFEQGGGVSGVMSLA